MSPRKWGAAAGVAAAGVLAVGLVALADEGDEIEEPVIRSYDVGNNAPRVVAWCFGEDAVYQANESDGLAVVGDSPNCDEGGLLTVES